MRRLVLALVGGVVLVLSFVLWKYKSKADVIYYAPVVNVSGTEVAYVKRTVEYSAEGGSIMPFLGGPEPTVMVKSDRLQLCAIDIGTWKERILADWPIVLARADQLGVVKPTLDWSAQQLRYRIGLDDYGDIDLGVVDRQFPNDDRILSNVSRYEKLKNGPFQVGDVAVDLDADPERARFPRSNSLVIKRKDQTIHGPVPPPSPETEATEDSLIDRAAGTDPAASYSALEELVARLERNSLSADGLGEIISAGLSRQADSGSQWRAHYGYFIEHAWTKGLLTEEQKSRYLRNAIGTPRLVAHPSNWLKDAPITFSIDVAPRVGYGHDPALTQIRGLKGPKRPMQLFVVIQSDRIRVDGQEAIATSKLSQPPQIASLQLEAGTLGVGFQVTTPQPLPAGEHLLSASCRLAVEPGKLRGRPQEPEDRTKAIRVEWMEELTCNFVMPAN